MLALFNKGLADAPKELRCTSHNGGPGPKLPSEILQDFMASGNAAVSLSFNCGASLAYSRPDRQSFSSQSCRRFCGLDDIYCVFRGSLHNLCGLIKQYGLSKATNEPMLVIEAYRTLRDRGPYPADQVLKELEGDYGFVIFDSKAGTVFAASGANEGVRLFWGIARDGSMVISDDLEVVKGSCGKSFAPFPAGCMFHSEQGLKSFLHPTKMMKAMPRIDSEGAMCGANFKVDVHSKVNSMPRVGSEVNWAIRGQNA
ncbi:hypothetical protein MLD38_027532 [Melastoma candidum]|uniref:Uncharacterized protein n=1 Tax=Melastoma candidum TaxID=119954 RepID=A0ACB9P6L3_9MYRT|nr:hypothetical protein MLD38_027532 [Melastoma candidum]